MGPRPTQPVTQSRGWGGLLAAVTGPSGEPPRFPLSSFFLATDLGRPGVNYALSL